MQLRERPRRATFIVALGFDLADRLIDEARRRDLAVGEVVEALLSEHWPPRPRVLPSPETRSGAPVTLGAASRNRPDQEQVRAPQGSAP